MQNEKEDDFPSHEELCKHIRSLGHRDDKDWTVDDYLNNVQFKFTPRATIANCATRLQNLPSPLNEEFSHWWNTGEINSVVNVKGVTIEQIINQKELDVFFAFVLLADLYQNPDDYILYRMLTHHRAFLHE